jgi:hypothetical protein
VNRQVESAPRVAEPSLSTRYASAIPDAPPTHWQPVPSPRRLRAEAIMWLLSKQLRSGQSTLYPSVQHDTSRNGYWCPTSDKARQRHAFAFAALSSAVLAACAARRRGCPRPIVNARARVMDMRTPKQRVTGILPLRLRQPIDGDSFCCWSFKDSIFTRQIWVRACSYLDPKVRVISRLRKRDAVGCDLRGAAQSQGAATSAGLHASSGIGLNVPRPGLRGPLSNS